MASHSDLASDKPISPAEATEAMEAIIADRQDPEVQHGRMDHLLCRILASLGYESTVLLFQQAAKWYG